MNTFAWIYTTVSTVLVSVGLFLAYWALEKRERKSFDLGMAMLSGVLTMIFYVISAYMKNYFSFSLYSSLYFFSVDVTLVFLLTFTLHYTETKIVGLKKILLLTLFMFVAFDSMIMLINPFWEIAISYEPRKTLLVSFVYDIHFLYDLHLTICYVMVLAIVISFVGKSLKTPGIYKKLYLFPLGAIMFVVILNAAFLILPGMTLDIAVWGYPIAALFLYWFYYHYYQRGLLNHFKGVIFDKVDQGLALFDYTDHMLLYNERLTKILPEVDFRIGMSIDELQEKCAFPKERTEGIDRRSIQIYTENRRALRCDLNVIRGGRHMILARLFVFTDIQRDTDVLTGFHNWDSFRCMAEEEPGRFERPIAIAVLDINGLSMLNSTKGRNEGDRAIQELSERMKMIFPRETYFVRGEEALLYALCYHMNEKEALSYCRYVASGLSVDVEYAASYLDNLGSDLLERMEQARRGLYAKKMLNRHSGRSSSMTSLIQALQECDSDTEAHVRRTREAGARLGERLGLSDVQQGNLALLCLLHDIGKIGIPLEILNKPGKLNDSEWRVLKSHVEKGRQICISSPELIGIADMVYHHHERWDGKGYPDGLSRESIPILSRIIAVVDAYDAMTNDRSYRAALPVEKAREELMRCAGSQFDPYITSEYLKMLSEDDEAAANDKKEKAGRKGKEKNSKEGGKKSLSGDTEEAAGTVKKFDEASSPAIPLSTFDQIEASNENTHFIHEIHYSRYIVNEHQQIVEIDNVFTELTGYTAEDIQRKKMTQMDLIFPEDRTDYLCLVNEQLARRARACFEHRIKRKNGSILYVTCMGKLFYDSATREERSEIIISDSTRTFAMKVVADEERERAENRLRRWESLYRLDSLTGLLNHEAYRNDVGERILHRDTKLLMMMIDLDRFKSYNDTYGHHAGDQLLVQFSQFLVKSLRGDDLACRMGGDEFSICMSFKEDVSEEIMNRRAREIYERLSLKVAGEKGGLGLSIGAAIYREKFGNFDRLYEAADKALYYSKEHGRGQLTMYSEERFGNAK